MWFCAQCVEAVENECLLDFEDVLSLFVMLGIIVLSYVFDRCCHNAFQKKQTFLLNYLSNVNDQRNQKKYGCFMIFTNI